MYDVETAAVIMVAQSVYISFLLSLALIKLGKQRKEAWGFILGIRGHEIVVRYICGTRK